ncbi:hypothetical protein G0U57_005461, partial [Chelydra serpentina]
SDPLPQPTLNVDPPLGVVREGGAVLLSCVVPVDAVHWRFHFYKDSVQIIPRDAGSEHSGVVYSTMETGGHLSNWSMLYIPQTTQKSAGEYACEYEEDVSGQWILSPKSEVVNVEVTGEILHHSKCPSNITKSSIHPKLPPTTGQKVPHSNL